MTPFEISCLMALALLLVLNVFSLLRTRSQNHNEQFNALQQALQQAQQQQLLQQQTQERALREQIQSAAQASRQELGGNFVQFQQTLSAQMQSVASLQNAQIESFAKQLEQMRQGLLQLSQTAREEQTQNLNNFGQVLQNSLHNTSETHSKQLEQMRLTLTQMNQGSREEQALSLQRFGELLQQSLNNLIESNAQRMLEVRATLEEKIGYLQADNASKLEEMRKTVDEKLHATLEQRLGESFKLVSDRLDKVHQGLGEMQQLAIGVGDLKRVLTNVKTRGTWGEVQLEMVLEQMLTPDQYAKNVETIPNTGERVEFAIKLPGKEDDKAPVWMPIDAKFPKEQYERLLDAAERADAEGVATAGKELERVIRNEAKTISEKYLSPPLTTDFAILFLPTEGLYAEVMRRPGLADDMQRTHRISIAGPSTLSALLNSLQMGFRTLVLEKRSSEVWQVLGAVKTEFGKFGDILAKTREALEKAAKNIDQAEVRTRQMTRKLKSVEALPSEAAQGLLGDSMDLLDE